MGVDKWTEEQIEWLRNNMLDESIFETTKRFNAAFGTNRTPSALQHKVGRCGIQSGYIRSNHGRHSEYTAEEDQWIISADPSLTWLEITEKFNERFGRNKSKQAMQARAYKLEKTIGFKYNGIGERVSSPIGKETYWAKDDVVVIKTGDPNKCLNNHKGWELKHHYIWERANGPIRKGEKIIFLDNDHTNCELDNLYLTTNEVMSCMRRLFGKPSTPELTLSALKTSELIVELTKGMTAYERKKFWKETNETVQLD